MKRLILLLLPVVAMALGAPEPSAPPPRETALGKLWQAAVSAESGSDAPAALAKLNAFSNSGGDPYMASLHSGWVCYNARKYEEAARYYLAASNLQPGALSPRLGLLNVAQQKGDGAAAIAAAESVLKIEPTNYRALMAEGWGAFQGKDYRRSCAAYQRVLMLYPEDPDALSGASWCKYYTGQKREAFEGFRRLIVISPDHAYARQGVALTAK